MKIAHVLAHLVFPRHTNNHKAKILHSSSLFLIALAFASVQVFINFTSYHDGDVLGYAANISVDDVIALTNQKRIEAGLEPLTKNANLSTGAYSKGQHMLANDYWAHVAPDGTQPWKFFGDVGYKYRYAGENLARDFSSPQAAVDAWMNSPSHRENMLSPKYKEIGVGVVEGDLAGVDTTIVVQFFGAPLLDTIPVQPIAASQTEVEPVAAETPIPTPTFVPILSPAPIANLVRGESQVLISPFNTTKALSTGLIGLLLLAFIIDIIVISRRRIARVSGRSIAHIAFLGMILVIVVIIQAGQIL